MYLFLSLVAHNGVCLLTPVTREAGKKLGYQTHQFHNKRQLFQNWNFVSNIFENDRQFSYKEE